MTTITKLHFNGVDYDIGNNAREQFVCGENITKGDLVAVRDYMGTLNPSTINVGDSTNTKVSTYIYGGGNEGNNMSCYIGKVGNGQDITIRIETDNNGKPSGTLVNANATATVLASSLTTTLTITNIQFLGNFILTQGVKYWVVFSCNNSDNSNYIIIGEERTSLTGDMVYSSGVWSDEVSNETITATRDGGDTPTSSGRGANQWFKIVFDIDLLIVNTSYAGATTVQIVANGATIYSGSVNNINIQCSKGIEYTFTYNNGAGDGVFTPPTKYEIPYGKVTGFKDYPRTRNVSLSFTIGTSSGCLSLTSNLFSNLLKKVDINNLLSFSDEMGIATDDFTIGQVGIIQTKGTLKNDNRNFIAGQKYYITNDGFTYKPGNVNRIKIGIAKSKNILDIDIGFCYNDYAQFYSQFSGITGVMYNTASATSNYENVVVDGTTYYFAQIPFSRGQLIGKGYAQGFYKNMG